MRLRAPRRPAAAWASAASRAQWWAYKLEMGGEDVYVRVWSAGVFFFGASAFLLSQTITAKPVTPCFRQGKLAHLEVKAAAAEKKDK